MAFLLEEECNLALFLNSSNKKAPTCIDPILQMQCATETQKSVIGYTLLPSAKAATRLCLHTFQ